MTFMLATPSTIDAPALTYLQMATPQIANAASVTGAPWLHSALAQLRDLEHTGEMIRGLGDLRIAPDTAMRTRLLLLSVGIQMLPSPVVSPVSGGGISIIWSLGPKEVKFSVEPNGETTYFKIKDDEISDDGAATTFNNNLVTEQLQWMLDDQV